MGKNQSASNITNIIKQDANGGISFMSGSTMLMSISSSGAITTTGTISGSDAATAVSASYSVSSSYAVASSTTVSSSYAVSASAAVSSETATSASYSVMSTSTVTASYADAFTVKGNLIAQTLVVQTVTSSVVYTSGSNVFGNSISNTHQFTGSVAVTGSVSVNGALSGTNATFNGKVAWGTSTYAAGVSSLYNTAEDGTILLSKTGTVRDFLLANGVGATVMSVATGTTNVTFTGALNGTSLSMSGGVFDAANGTLSADILRVKGGGGTGVFGFKVEANNGDDIFYTDHFNYNVISNPVTGTFLIGTTTPEAGYKLIVNGKGKFSNTVKSDDGFEGRYYKILEASASRGGLYPYNLIVGSGTDYSVGVFSEGEIYLASGGSVTKRLTISNTGAATFSSSGRFEGDLNVGAGAGNYFTRVTTAYNFPYVDSYIDSYAGASYEGRLNFRTNSGGGVMGIKMKLSNSGNLEVVGSVYSLGLNSNISGLTGTMATFGTNNNASTRFEFTSNASGGANDNYSILHTIIHGSGGGYRISHNVDTRWIQMIAGSGGVQLSGTATSWSSISDATLKKNIKPITNALQKSLGIEGCYFDYNYDTTDNSSRVGVIAQQVNEVFPEAVEWNYNEEEKRDIASVRYTELIPLLFNAIRELKAEFDQYKASHP